MTPTDASTGGRPWYARPGVTVLAVLAFALAFQGTRPLWEPDEGRYTNVACQMLRTGNFLTPALNDQTPHFSKPPLTYWAIAGGIALLGRNEWGVRFANALAFAATILLVAALGRTVTPQRPWLPAVIYATLPFPFAAANVVTTDTLLTLWETLAVLAFVRWWRPRGVQRSACALMLMWLGFGLAFLTKGPPGLLPLLVIIAFLSITDGPRTVLGLFRLSGLAVFALVGLGWYLWAVTHHAGLAEMLLRREVWERFTSPALRRNAQWYKVFTIYFPVMFGGALPWSLGLVRAAPRLVPPLFTRPWWRERLAVDPWPPFLVLWIIVPLAIFSLSRSRMPLYLLPLFVPVALIAARVVSPTILSRRTVRLLAAWLILLVAVKGAAAFFPYPKVSRPVAQAIAAHVRPRPRRIAFVGVRPFWGLSLYLGSEILNVRYGDRMSPDERQRALQCALAKPRPPTLLIVADIYARKALADLAALGFDIQETTSLKSWRLWGVNGEFAGRDLPPPAADAPEAGPAREEQDDELL